MKSLFAIIVLYFFLIILNNNFNKNDQLHSQNLNIKKYIFSYCVCVL